MAAFALLTIWSNLPWWTGPATDRFALWPDGTRDAIASNAPIEPLLLKTENTQYVEEKFFPVEELRRWLAIAHLETSDVSAISLLNTVQDGGGWWLKDWKFDYDEITSAIAVLELSTSATNIVADLPRSEGSLESIAGKPAFAFDNPFEGLEKRGRNVGPAIEKWYLAAPTDRVLLIGGRTAVEQVLKTAAGERDGITTRRVLGPLLKVIEPAPELHAHFVPPTKERAIPVVSAVMMLLSHVPGLDLLYSYRARAIAFTPLPAGGCFRTVAYQYEDRAAGRIHSTFLWSLSFSDSPHAKGYAALSGGRGLAAFTEPAACTDDVTGPQEP